MRCAEVSPDFIAASTSPLTTAPPGPVPFNVVTSIPDSMSSFLTDGPNLCLLTVEGLSSSRCSATFLSFCPELFSSVDPEVDGKISLTLPISSSFSTCS
jgi:hypothetical protein